MKQFIVLIAILPIMLLFMMQIGYEQRNISTVNRIQAAVYAAKEEAKLAGYFSEERIQILEEELESIPGVASASVYSPQTFPQARYSLGENRFIDYEVKVVLENVMAGGNYIIDSSKNSYVYEIRSYTASEYLE